jgi:hypothetical protein
MTKNTDNEYLIEIVRIGNSCKISAIDSETGTEVSTMGPLHASEAQLARVAIAKLRYVLAKNSKKTL